MLQVLYSEGDETLEQVTQGSYGCPFLGQVGVGLEQPTLVEGVPAYGT